MFGILFAGNVSQFAKVNTYDDVAGSSLVAWQILRGSGTRAEIQVH